MEHLTVEIWDAIKKPEANPSLAGPYCAALTELVKMYRAAGWRVKSSNGYRKASTYEAITGAPYGFFQPSLTISKRRTTLP